MTQQAEFNKTVGDFLDANGIPHQKGTTVTVSGEDLPKIAALGEQMAVQEASEECGKHCREAEPSVCNLVRAVMHKHFPALVQLSVTVKTLFAYAGKDKNGDPKGPAMKRNGIALAGKIKVTSQADRAAGLDDAVMTLDGDRWDEWMPRTQEALIHHELTHLETTGKVDDCGRPKLKSRPHDHECGVFEATMAAYGKDALDTKVVAEIATDCREFVQGMLDWG